MTAAAYFGRGLLASVLLLAMLAKSGSREGRATYLTVVDELSPWSARRSSLLAGTVLVVELAVSGALLAPQVPAAIALPATVLLLLAFTLALLKLLGSGTSTSCACFGAWSRGQIGPAVIGRNLALIGLALASLALAGRSRADWVAAPLAVLSSLAVLALGRVVLAGRRRWPTVGQVR